MQAELVLNLWAIYDANSGFVYALSGKAYYLGGTDEEKLIILQKLSVNDYITAKRYELPDRFSVKYSDGTVQRKVANFNIVADPNAQLFEDIFKNIEVDLPDINTFHALGCTPAKQKVPTNPLCVTTILYEDEFGNIRPIISQEDREWLLRQKAAHR